MKKKLKKLNINKLLVFLLILSVIFFLLGIFYITILNNDNKLLIKDNTNNYLNAIKTNNVKYQTTLFKATTGNVLTNLLIWLSGISLIGIVLIFLIYIFKCFLLSFTVTSIIYNFKVKGILFALIYAIPMVINLVTVFFLTYYAISFSIMLFNYFFRKKDYNRRVIVKRYFKILIISLAVGLFSSIIETFLIPQIIKLIYF